MARLTAGGCAPPFTRDKEQRQLAMALLPRRSVQPEQVCPHFHGAVGLIGRRWAGAILYALTDGPLHYAELKEAVPGMSDSRLSTRLKELERAGLVRRELQPGTRVRVSYELTRKGHSLEPAIGNLRDWARRWHPA